MTVFATNPHLAPIATAFLALSGCGGGNDANSPATTPTAFTVGGVVSGLSRPGLVLQLNGFGSLSVTVSGSFVFETRLQSSASFSVAIAVQPSGQTCTIGNGAGIVAGTNVSDIAVTCTTVALPVYTVGGTVTSLAGTGLVLQNNGADDLPVPSDGVFAFPTAMQASARYSASVASQPRGQTCTISGGSGTVADANVRSIAINCVTDLVPLFVDDFERPDQQGLGFTPDGQKWLITGPGYLKVAIKDGRYVGGPPETDNNVSYVGVLTSQSALRFGGKYSFVPSGTGGSQASVVALISSNDTVFTLRRMVHLIAGRFGVALTWWQESDQNNAPLACVGSSGFSAPLANDGRAYPLYMTIRGDTVTVDKPDGSQLICTDPHFSLLAGPLGIWELAYGSADADVPRWDKAEAFIEAAVR